MTFIRDSLKTTRFMENVYTMEVKVRNLKDNGEMA